MAHVRDRGRLGDLEHEPAGVDAGGGDLALDQLGELRVADRAAGQVELEPVAAVLVRGELLDRGAHDPAVEFSDQAELLGGLDELHRRDHLAVDPDHPQQDLVVGRGVGRELDDRLPVQDEAVLVERAADLIGARRAAPAFRRSGPRAGRPLASGACGARSASSASEVTEVICCSSKLRVCRWESAVRTARSIASTACVSRTPRTLTLVWASASQWRTSRRCHGASVRARVCTMVVASSGACGWTASCSRRSCRNRSS